MPEYALAFAGKENAKRINRRLTDGLFFHRGDQPELYAVLYSNKDRFIEFWDEYHGTELVVKQDVAYRRHGNADKDPFAGFENTDIPDDARLHFYFRGREAKLCLLIFARFLYWYETTVRKTTPQAYGEFHFSSHEFFTWVNQEITRFFQGKAAPPTPEQFHKAHRLVMKELVRYGFLRVHETREVEGDELVRLRATQYADKKLITYAARPALTAYDPFILDKDPSTFRRAFGHEADDHEPGDDPEEEDAPA